METIFEASLHRDCPQSSRPGLCDPLGCTPHAPPAMGFFRQEYWNGLLFLPPGALPDLRVKPMSSAFQMDSSSAEALGKRQWLRIFLNW